MEASSLRALSTTVLLQQALPLRDLPLIVLGLSPSQSMRFRTVKAISYASLIDVGYPIATLATRACTRHTQDYVYRNGP